MYKDYILYFIMIMLYYIMLYYVILCYIMLYYVILCYIMLYYVILCYIMLYYVILWIFPRSLSLSKVVISRDFVNKSARFCFPGINSILTLLFCVFSLIK
jgi:hypothetical protein